MFLNQENDKLDKDKHKEEKLINQSKIHPVFSFTKKELNFFLPLAIFPRNTINYFSKIDSKIILIEQKEIIKIHYNIRRSFKLRVLYFL